MDPAASDVAADAPAYPHAPIPMTTLSPALVTVGEASGSIGSGGIRSDERTAGEPLRKRQRTTQDLDTTSTASADQTGGMGLELMDSSAEWPGAVTVAGVPSAATRDEKYYYKEGDCVIRVENTLFKVHRFLLARDSSAFEHMFSMPGHEGEGCGPGSEGSSDERPIVLHGEKATNFRALLSAMYALPAELHLYTTEYAPLATLLTIAETTNKYHFATTENWAINALYTVLTTTDASEHLMHCNSSLLRRVVEVALLCQHDGLRIYALERWMSRIRARKISPLDAMAVADEYGLVKLKGVSYYAALLECGDRLEWDATSFSDPNNNESLEYPTEEDDTPISRSRSPSPSPPVTLTARQKACLLSGFFSLTNLWDRLRTSAPTFDKPPGCTYHAHGCLSTWRAIWGNTARSEKTLRDRTADVVGRLKSMEGQLLVDADLHCALTPACRRAAMESVRGLRVRVEDGLAEHFVDLTG